MTHATSNIWNKNKKISKPDFLTRWILTSAISASVFFPISKTLFKIQTEKLNMYKPELDDICDTWRSGRVCNMLMHAELIMTFRNHSTFLLSLTNHCFNINEIKWWRRDVYNDTTKRSYRPSVALWPLSAHCFDLTPHLLHVQSWGYQQAAVFRKQYSLGFIGFIGTESWHVWHAQ